MTYIVRITGYRMSPLIDMADTVSVYTSEHRSPHAAARCLASIIAGRTAFARHVRAGIPRDYCPSFLIEDSGCGLASAERVSGPLLRAGAP